MYFQSDYILRMIEMGTAFYRKLLEMMLGVSQEQREALAERSLNGEMLARVGLDLNAVRAMPHDTLTAILPDPGSRAILMEYLLAAYELLDSVPHRSSLAEKALYLLVTIPPESVTSEHLYARARLILDRLDGVVGAPMHAALADYFEALGHLDAAEDQFHFAGDPNAITSFYRRMMSLNDDALGRGGLLREDVRREAEAL